MHEVKQMVGQARERHRVADELLFDLESLRGALILRRKPST